MVQYVQGLVAAWRRHRRAKQIQQALVQVGYTADDLIQLAQLRATVERDAAGTVGLPDPAEPTLGEVLAVWQLA